MLKKKEVNLNGMNLNSRYLNYYQIQDDGKTIKVDRTGTLTRGIVLHLLMHAFGFRHEHRRADAEYHVIFQEDKLRETSNPVFYAGLFDVDPSYQPTTPYDFGSILHFGPSDFAESSTDYTLIANPCSKNHTGDPNAFGQRSDLSPTDIVRLKEILPCNG